MAHVNSITKRERDGYYLYSDQGIKLGGPFASSYEADSLGEYLSDTLRESPVEEYQRLGSQMGPSEGRTTTIEGTPNPWGDLPTEKDMRNFRGRTTGYPFGERDWRNIVPNTLSDIRGGLQGLFEREEDNLFDYNPKAELQEELKRTGLEEQYLKDTTRYRGPEPPEDRSWTSRLSPISTAQAHMQPMSGEGLGAAGLLDQQFGMGLDFPDRSKYGLKPTTEGGVELVEVGTYNLSADTRKSLEGDSTGELPWYEDRAYLVPKAAAAFEEMRDAYFKETGNDIPLESAYRTTRHNAVLSRSVKGSDHMDGTVIDISKIKHQAIIDWIRKPENKKFGWHFAHYKGNTGHFEYTG